MAGIAFSLGPRLRSRSHSFLRLLTGLMTGLTDRQIAAAEEGQADDVSGQGHKSQKGHIASLSADSIGQ